MSVAADVFFILECMITSTENNACFRFNEPPQHHESLAFRGYVRFAANGRRLGTTLWTSCVGEERGKLRRVTSHQ